MDYKQKYEEALERAKIWRDKYCTHGNLGFGDVLYDKTGDCQKELDNIFPELNEQKKEDISELTEFEAELFSMMSDAWQGYLRGEEVNIAKIVKEHSSELLERANKQKPALTEEDEALLANIIIMLKKGTIDWLKSIKEIIGG